MRMFGFENLNSYSARRDALESLSNTRDHVTLMASRALISLSLLACCNAQAFPSFGGIWGGDDEAEKAPSRYESEPASVVIDASGSGGGE